MVDMLDVRNYNSKEFTNGWSWSMAYSGHHCLHRTGETPYNWQSYTSPAISEDKTLVVFTGYWEGFVPIETLIEMKHLDLQSKQTQIEWPTWRADIDEHYASCGDAEDYENDIDAHRES